jgi:hypothetical protein
MGEQGPDIHADLLASLGAAMAGRQVLRVGAWFADGTSTHVDAPGPRPAPPPAPRPAGEREREEQILAALRAAGRRLTLAEVAEALEAAGHVYGQSTVQVSVLRLRAQGRVSNARDARGRGYGPAEWAGGADGTPTA